MNPETTQATTTSPAAAAATTPAATPITIKSGCCYMSYAFDIGLAVDLDAVEALLRDTSSRHRFQYRQKMPAYFRYEPAPVHVRFSQPTAPVSDLALADDVEAVVFDFGVISVTFRLPLSGPLTSLLDVSEAIYARDELVDEARRIASSLMTTIKASITKPTISDAVEDYFVFHVESLSPECSARDLLKSHGGLVAGVLRAERQPLSEQEAADALDCQLSYGGRDLTIVDWNAAIVIDETADDTRAVLEYANVELLEMRYLDDRLDSALDSTYELLSKRRQWRLWPGTSHANLHRIAELQMDNALLFEGVNNALKLLGDPYLARVYRLAARRLHLSEWDASILRKLSSLESTYEKLAGLAAHRRSEILEWLIILLIAFSIGLELLMLMKE